MGPIGVQEMIAIFIIALVLFGPRKLPELARTLGKAISEFRRAKNELKASLETHLQELERETRSSDSNSPTYSSPRYSHPYEDYGRPSIDYSSSAPYEPEPHTDPAPAALPEPAPTSPAALPAPSAPVAGTVPRSNGAYSGDAAQAPVEQESSL
jgi:TatA/E family protein of Tat protein translocase